MTPDEIRVKVAQAMGFRAEWVVTPEESCVASHWLFTDPRTGFGVDCPDYPDDLNACAKFEATMSASESVVYDGWLMTLGGFDRAIKTHSPDGKPTDDFVRLIRCVRSAPPLRRCDAFLRTRGKWQD